MDVDGKLKKLQKTVNKKKPVAKEYPPKFQLNEDIVASDDELDSFFDHQDDQIKS